MATTCFDFLIAVFFVATQWTAATSSEVSKYGYDLNLLVDSPPTYSRPYVLRYLDGPAYVLINDVIRSPLTNASTGGAFSVVQINAQPYVRSGYGDLYAAPAHYHSRFHETFFCNKGEVTLWANKEARMLGPQDFGSMPMLQNHSYSFTEPDSELFAFIQPGGFENFYINISVPLDNPAGAPFAPDHHQHFLETTFAAAVGPRFDVFPIFNYSFAYNFTNGTTALNIPWHNGNNTLPPNATEPYFLANNWSPKYLHRSLGQVIQPRVTSVQSGGNFSISTIVMRRHLANETIIERSFPVPQMFRVLEGTMRIRMIEQTVDMSTGDVAFIPAGIPFSYWTDTSFAKVFFGAGGDGGLDTILISQAEPWAYAVFPAYIG